jgi:hypothetical protein
MTIADENAVAMCKNVVALLDVIKSDEGEARAAACLLAMHY